MQQCLERAPAPTISSSFFIFFCWWKMSTARLSFLLVAPVFPPPLRGDSLTRQKLYLVGQSISTEGGRALGGSQTFIWLTDWYVKWFIAAGGGWGSPKECPTGKCPQAAESKKVSKQNGKSFTQLRARIYFTPYLCHSRSSAPFFPVPGLQKLSRTLYVRIK